MCLIGIYTSMLIHPNDSTQLVFYYMSLSGDIKRWDILIFSKLTLKIPSLEFHV